jgi:DNA mismatch endonuclease (patch repair protein)
MAAVKSHDTKLERDFFDSLEFNDESGIERYPVDIVGKPDLIHRRAKIAVFIDSCFWHGCPVHLRMPDSNRDYWIQKISRNRKRDLKVNRQLRLSGWAVIRVWEHSLKRSRSRKWWLTRIVNRLTASSIGLW